MSERISVLQDGRPVPCTINEESKYTGVVGYRNFQYMGPEKHCMLCLRKTPVEFVNHGITREHLVPKDVRNRFPDTIGLVVNDPRNHIKICPITHRDIDGGEPGRRNNGHGGKIYIYNTEGMSGLVRFLAQYPRAIDATYFSWQEIQFRDLFKVLGVQVSAQLAVSKGLHYQLNREMLGENWFDVLIQHSETIHRAALDVEDLTKAQDAVGFYLEEWKKGNFENQFLIAA